LSGKPRIDPKKTMEMQERTKERNLIVQEIKTRGPSTVGELSKTIGIERSRLLRHMIAMRQFGKVLIVGERDDQFVYDLPNQSK
jgi:predicted ArsR family transcriptional regulator